MTRFAGRLAIAAGACLLLLAAPAAAQDPEEPTQPQPRRLQLEPPSTLQQPNERPNADLRLAPASEGLQLRPPGQVAQDELDDALDDVLDEPWPDEETDGDFDEPLEGGDDWGDEPVEPTEPEALDPETEAALDDAFGAVDAHGEESAHAAHGEGAEGEHGPGADHEEGEHGGHHEAHFDPIKFLATVVNFLIWLAIVVWLGRKPISEYLKNRRLAVEEGLEEAKRLSAEAQEKHAEYSARLERLDEELDKLKGEMIQAGEVESDRIIQEAEARAARMRKDATFLVEQQMKQLRLDLTREAIEAAVAAAEEVLSKQVAANDQQRLADDYLSQIAESMRESEGEARA